jgi:hypothetical protein
VVSSTGDAMEPRAFISERTTVVEKCIVNCSRLEAVIKVLLRIGRRLDVLCWPSKAVVVLYRPLLVINAISCNRVVKAMKNLEPFVPRYKP